MRKSAAVSKTLIIAEKPSVATDLSKALAKSLGKFEKKGKSRDAQYFENDKAMITSAVGHLVELKMPTGPNGKNLPWKFDVLPAIPKKFELQPIEQTEGRLRHILKLLLVEPLGSEIVVALLALALNLAVLLLLQLPQLQEALAKTQKILAS